MVSLVIKRFFVETIKKALLSRGYALTRISHLQRATMISAMKSVANRGHVLKTVIDIGASDGRWSQLAMKALSRCRYFLMEAQAVHEPALIEFCKRRTAVEYVLAAVGHQVGEINFQADRPFGGSASLLPFASHNVRLPLTTIDHEVAARNLEGPFLLKFDTHGFENQILIGAQQTLKQTEIIVMECYNYKISPESLIFHQMCAQLEDLGFRCIDLVDPLYRPYDDTFWQMDLVFARSTRSEFLYHQYE